MTTQCVSKVFALRIVALLPMHKVDSYFYSVFDYVVHRHCVVTSFSSVTVYASCYRSCYCSVALELLTSSLGIHFDTLVVF